MKYEDFLNSKSMLTPGVAGAVCMFLSNAVVSKFDAEQFLFHIVMGLSFLMGLLVLSDKGAAWPTKVVLYVINSLFIFAMATGSNDLIATAGIEKTELKEEIQQIDSIDISEAGSKNKIMMFVQDVDSSKVRKKYLSDKIVSTSTMIVAVQKQLVENADQFNEPEQKLNRLKEINRSLLSVNNRLKDQNNVSKETESNYEGEILEVQHNLGVLQRALLLEKKQTQKKFFKPWFKD